MMAAMIATKLCEEKMNSGFFIVKKLASEITKETKRKSPVPQYCGTGLFKKLCETFYKSNISHLKLLNGVHMADKVYHFV